MRCNVVVLFFALVLAGVRCAGGETPETPRRHSGDTILN